MQGDIGADQSAQHDFQVEHQSVHVEHPRGEHLPPAEGQQLLGETGRAPRGLGDLRRVERRRRARVQALHQERGRPEDRREQVVEIVRDPAREPSHDFHLLRLPVLHLELPHLGEVGGDREQSRDPSGTVVEGADGQTDGQRGSVFLAAGHLHAADHLAPQHALPEAHVLGRVGGDDGQRPPDDLVGAPSVQGFRRRIPGAHDGISIDGVDGERGGVHGRAEILVRVLQGVLGAPMLHRHRPQGQPRDREDGDVQEQRRIRARHRLHHERSAATHRVADGDAGHGERRGRGTARSEPERRRDDEGEEQVG